MLRNANLHVVLLNYDSGRGLDNLQVHQERLGGEDGGQATVLRGGLNDQLVGSSGADTESFGNVLQFFF